MTKKRIAITITDPNKQATGEALAYKLNLDIVPAGIQDSSRYEYLLVFTPDYVGLLKTSDKKFAPFYINFLSGKLQYRLSHAGLRSELLARALGAHPRNNPVIVDATAGLGRDSFLLASLGFRVTMLERSPILYALLQDALTRAQTDSRTTPIIERLKLLETDAISWLKACKSSDRPDIVYLDPMFPERQKSASVKKEMVLLQDLLGKDEDSAALLQVALTCATKRVVVKRPRLAAMIAQQVATFSITGKNSRFDIYLV